MHLVMIESVCLFKQGLTAASAFFHLHYRTCQTNREGFARFLVQSPLVSHTPPPPVQQKGWEDADFQVPYGSYHQLYRLDGRLIAVRCFCFGRHACGNMVDRPSLLTSLARTSLALTCVDTMIGPFSSFPPPLPKHPSNPPSLAPFTLPHTNTHQHTQVGVVDVLPHCLSSVYCFYDPAFRQLSLGKLTALWEIHWVTQASRFRCVLC